jgi:anaerobic selenocysteine-containing dehydrogenase
MTAAATTDTARIHGFCGLCIARCGSVATVENGRFTRLDPDPAHPTGAALCAKGRAAPELVYAKDRLTKPLERTQPKGDPHPGWREISWDDALERIAVQMQRIAREYGPEAFAFSQSSPSTTAIGDGGPFIRRLMNAYGTPNFVHALEVCGWGRGGATKFAWGVGSVATGGGGGAMADIENAGCIILWGYNPSSTRLTHAIATIAAQKRGAKLIVIDPRQAGLANKADVWLRVRPSSDGALALGLANVMIERGWYDRDFIRDWTNGPLLVRADTGRLLRAGDLGTSGDARAYVAWDLCAGGPVGFDPRIGRYEAATTDLAIDGEHRVATTEGNIVCRPVFDHFAMLCRKYSPSSVEATCWVPRAQLEEAARLIWHARPTAYYAWSGHEQHDNTTETARAISLLYALTGSFDQRGGNVLLPAVPGAPITGEDLPSAKGMAPAIGAAERPLGPAGTNNVSPHDFYRAILQGLPYRPRGLLGFGSNLLLAHADPVRGREALSRLEFYAHADLFMSPTSALADIVLPVASCFERESLKLGFEISVGAQSLVQYRHPVVPAIGEARSDTEIVFGLARRLGLAEHFWDGDIDAAYRHQLAPSGLTLDQLKAQSTGIQMPLTPVYAKHARPDAKGVPRGFATQSRKVELWSETLQDHGHSPLPDFVETRTSPFTRPDLVARYPLVLTCAKPTVFCQTQHRTLASLRRRSIDPEVEVHPDTAAARGLAEGAWVRLETPSGVIRARLRLNGTLDPRVVVGEHGWWAACNEVGAPGYDPFVPSGSNFNATVDATARDPIGGTPAMRANLCEIGPASP